MKRLAIPFLLLVSTHSIFAQVKLPIPSFIQQTYTNGTRDTSGKPGLKYWQNSADYHIKIKLNTYTRDVSGTVDIAYTNNSPDTLTEIWFKLYPNLYKRGVDRKSKIAEADLGNGVVISGIQIDNQPKALSSLIVEGTNMYTDIRALAPGEMIKLKIDYSYILNEGSPVRTGQVDKGAFFVAYFFPRITVYDDVDGWNKVPYTGREEFYNDFCNFKAAITVPNDYVVWATGDLLNAKMVLSKRIAKRLQKASSSDSITDIIDSTDLKKGNNTRKKLFNTWKFEAKNVTDFVFAVSNHYVWQSSSVVVDTAANRRTSVNAAFNPVHKNYYEWIDFTRKTVHAMSFNFPKWSFPYTHETVFEGLDEMEYPMMVNANWVKDRSYAIGLVDHEIFHTILPFYVGTNESKYAWMDEGWAAMGEFIISSMIDSTVVGFGGVKEYGGYSGSEGEKSIVTFSTLLDRTGYSFNSYVKPALGYMYIRDYLGDDLFTKALHHYITQWKGKHPMPFDFFNCINEGAGKNLNWFWKSWFFDDGIVDMAIVDVSKEDGGYAVNIENKGSKALPVDLVFTYTDGSTDKLHRSIGIWERGNRNVILSVNTAKSLQKVELGSIIVPDKNKADNACYMN